MTRNYLARALALLTPLTLILLSGFLHGELSGRWGSPAHEVLAATALQALPEELGNWRLALSHELSDAEQSILKCQSSVLRTYEDNLTGERVRLVLLMGPPDRLAAHTPDICLSRRLYRLRTSRERIEVASTPGVRHVFWRNTFDVLNLNGGMLCTYYALSNDGQWAAPQAARFAFPGERFLYKLQISAGLASDAAIGQGDACQRFLTDLTPALTAILHSPPRSEGFETSQAL